MKNNTFVILLGAILVSFITFFITISTVKTEEQNCESVDVAYLLQEEKKWWLETHDGIIDAMENGDTLMASGGEDLITRRMYGDY
jgi:hypothetical protein